MAKGGPIQFDLIAGSMIKVKHALTDAESTKLVRYQLKAKDVEPAKIIPTDARQSLQAGPRRTRRFWK